jgi:hypothetical protein
MKNLASVAIATAPVVCLLVASGCGDSNAPGATGRLTVELADAPYPFDLIESATVVIDSVSVHLGGGSAEHSGFVIIDRAARSYDLLDLQNGVTATLVDAEVPVGKVNQIRLYVDHAAITLTDERVFALQVPSGYESGIKIFPSPQIEIVSELTTELLLDFDVSRSFKPIPNSPTRAPEIERFTFAPVVRVSNQSASGSLTGRVLGDGGTAGDPGDDLPIEGASVTAYHDGDEVTATATDGEGRYVILGLAAGVVTVEATATGFEPASRQATVVAANLVEVPDLVLGAGSAVEP